MSEPDLSWLLAPINETRMVGREKRATRLGGVRFPVRAKHGDILLYSDPNGSRRFVYEAGGYGLVSGLQVMTGGRRRVVANVYTLPRFRSRGLAAELFAVARRTLGPIEHSRDLSESGARFAARNRTSNRTAGSSHAADLNRRLHAVALAHPSQPVAVIERGECRGEAGPIVAETTRGYPRRLTVAVSIARDGGPGDGHPCEVTENDVISRRPAPEREVDRLRALRASRSHELSPGMNYANATAGAGRGRPVGYRCRACGTVTRRLPKSCARCKR